MRVFGTIKINDASIPQHVLWGGGGEGGGLSTVPRDGGNSLPGWSAGHVGMRLIGGGVIHLSSLENMVWWLGLFLSYGTMATSDEKSAADLEVAHLVHDKIRSGAALIFCEQYTVIIHATATGPDTRRR